MIYLGSRYAKSATTYGTSLSDDTQHLTVYRNWPNVTGEFFWHYWTKHDHLDQVAKRFLDDPERWWEIMDINPEITHPALIAIGTPVRIPRVR